MFWNRSPRLDASQVALRLVTVFTSAAHSVSQFEVRLSLDTAERVRLYFSALLFPAVAIAAEAEISRNSNRRVVEAACEIYLRNVPDKERTVRLGEYVIWAVERDNVMKSFQHNPALARDYSSATDTLPYGSLLTLAHYVRRRSYAIDTQLGLSKIKDPQDRQQTFQAMLEPLASTFAMQVLGIGSHQMVTNPQMYERAGVATALAGPIVGEMQVVVWNILAGK